MECQAPVKATPRSRSRRLTLRDRAERASAVRGRPKRSLAAVLVAGCLVLAVPYVLQQPYPLRAHRRCFGVRLKCPSCGWEVWAISNHENPRFSPASRKCMYLYGRRMKNRIGFHDFPGFPAMPGKVEVYPQKFCASLPVPPLVGTATPAAQVGPIGLNYI